MPRMMESSAATSNRRHADGRGALPLTTSRGSRQDTNASGSSTTQTAARAQPSDGVRLTNGGGMRGHWHFQHHPRARQSLGAPPPASQARLRHSARCPCLSVVNHELLPTAYSVAWGRALAQQLPGGLRLHRSPQWGVHTGDQESRTPHRVHTDTLISTALFIEPATSTQQLPRVSHTHHVIPSPKWLPLLLAAAGRAKCAPFKTHPPSCQRARCAALRDQAPPRRRAPQLHRRGRAQHAPLHTTRRRRAHATCVALGGLPLLAVAVPPERTARVLI